MKHEFYCSVCKKQKTHESDHTTGYAIGENEEKICFECCGYEDKANMILNGRNTLYFSYEGSLGKNMTVSNWPGTFKRHVHTWSMGRHNWGLHRYDVWFDGPDGFIWHGVTIGDHTQLCHCKRTQRKHPW